METCVVVSCFGGHSRYSLNTGSLDAPALPERLPVTHIRGSEI